MYISKQDNIMRYCNKIYKIQTHYIMTYYMHI